MDPILPRVSPLAFIYPIVLPLPSVPSLPGRPCISSLFHPRGQRDCFTSHLHCFKTSLIKGNSPETFFVAWEDQKGTEMAPKQLVNKKRKEKYIRPHLNTAAVGSCLPKFRKVQWIFLGVPNLGENMGYMAWIVSIFFYMEARISLRIWLFCSLFLIPLFFWVLSIFVAQISVFFSSPFCDRNSTFSLCPRQFLMSPRFAFCQIWCSNASLRRRTP